MRWERALLLGGCPPLLHPLAAYGKLVLPCGGSPPSSTILWLRAGGVCCCSGGAPPPPSAPWLRTGSARCRVGGHRTSSISWIRAGGAHGLVRVSPTIPWLRVRSASFWVGSPPPSSISWLCAKGALGLVGVIPSIPWPRAGGTCCWVGGPLLPPLVAARIKRSLMFGGYLLLGLILRLTACEERTLTVLFPRPCLPPVCAPCLQGVLGAVPATVRLRGGWVTCRIFLRQ